MCINTVVYLHHHQQHKSCSMLYTDFVIVSSHQASSLLLHLFIKSFHNPVKSVAQESAHTLIMPLKIMPMIKTIIYVLLKPIHHRSVLSSRICLCQCNAHCSYTGIQESLRTKTSRIFLCQNFKDLFRYTDTSQNLASYIFFQDKILTCLLVMPKTPRRPRLLL